MNHKIKKSILGGIIGTILMTMFMFVAPSIGLPEMSPPQMLSDMLGVPLVVAWLMHFIIGATFALAYAFFSIFNRKITGIYLRGAAFGLMVFGVARVMMAIMGAMMPLPAMEGPVWLALAGSLTGHVVFGMAVSTTVGEPYPAVKPEETK